MSDFLERILAHKKKLIQKKKNYYDTLKAKVSGEKFARYNLFKKAISQPGKISLIAEIKKASPSKGLIRPSFDVLSLAQVYVDSGASALSILTEDKFFLGRVPYLSRVSENYSIPILAKDFIIDEGQIYEAFSYGTSAILLIAAILSDEDLQKLKSVAAQFDLDCLVEVHNEAELARVLNAGFDIIGINNRDLHTFEVDLAVTEKLIPQIPQDKVVVSESGIFTHEDVLRVQNAGAHAILVGESLLREADIGQKIKELIYGSN